MKLLTEMRPFGDDGSRMLPSYGTSGSWYSGREHDAMAAHALLQAIAGLRSGASEEQVLAYDVALKRADEILAGWLGEDRG